MNIDLTKLITNNVDSINVNMKVYYDEEKLASVNIRKLNDTSFIGKIRKLYDDEYEVEGILSGVMVLADDITLEDVDYNFSIDIKEEFNEVENDDSRLVIVNNKLDFMEFLWQNIVLEIPSKIVSDKNKDIKLEGNGWRFISEEELENDKNNKSPFDELDNIF